MFDSMTGERIRQLSGHTGAVRALVFSCDGTRLASGCKGRSVRYWDAQSGAQLSVQADQHTKEVTSLQFSPCGKTLCSAGKDGYVVLWWAGAELALRCVLPDAQSVGNDVLRVQFSPNGGSPPPPVALAPILRHISAQRLAHTLSDMIYSPISSRKSTPHQLQKVAPLKKY